MSDSKVWAPGLLDLNLTIASRDIPSDVIRLMITMASFSAIGVVDAGEVLKHTGLTDERVDAAIDWMIDNGYCDIGGAIKDIKDWPAPPEVVEEPEKSIEAKKKQDKKKSSAVPESPIFEAAWKVYPSRGPHGNPKASAFKAWRGQVKSGVSEIDLLEATKNYARYQKEVGKVGTQYVAQAATFYGPSRKFEDYLTLREGDILSPISSPDWIRKQGADAVRESAKSSATSKKWEIRGKRGDS